MDVIDRLESELLTQALNRDPMYLDRRGVSWCFWCDSSDVDHNGNCAFLSVKIERLKSRIGDNGIAVLKSLPNDVEDLTGLPFGIAQAMINLGLAHDLTRSTVSDVPELVPSDVGKSVIQALKDDWDNGK